MTLRRLLLIPLAVSLAFFVYFSSDILASFQALMNAVHITRELIIVVSAAAILQVSGHVLRAKKMVLLLGRIKPSSQRFQFRALSVGYLFNTILPLRLGELIRARIISGAMDISFSFALVLIIFERAIDAILLGLTGLGLLLVTDTSVHRLLLTISLTLLTIGAVLLLAIILLVRQQRQLLAGWKSLTGVLNDSLKVRYRFKMWSIIYGLQQSLVRPTLLPYLGLTFLSWLRYALSAFILVLFLFPGISEAAKTLLTTAPFFGIARPAGPANLGIFSTVLDQLTAGLRFTTGQRLEYDLITWAVLVIPVSLLGLGLLFTKTRETLLRVQPQHITRNSLVNKLYRQEDISREMANFLDNFFAGNSLSNIVHRLERTDKFRLLKYFKGGSDAITILALEDGQEIVKKIIPLEFEDRLKAQYDWLDKFKDNDAIVTVRGEEHAADHYAINLDYDSKNQEFYDFIQRNPLQKSEVVLDKVFAQLATSVHQQPAKLMAYPDDRDAYINKHIIGCLEKAAAVDSDLVQAAAAETLYINDRPYDNLHQILEKIRLNPQSWADIATYSRTKYVHGDVIVDNLLVSRETGKPLIIDPAPDGNIITGPVFDFGKAMQSLYCGYEGLLRDLDQVYLLDGNRIDFSDNTSLKYDRLSDYVRHELAPRYLSEGEQRAMLFHAGALYIRRLKHQVYYTPANALKFYAVGVRTLNDFYRQYETV